MGDPRLDFGAVFEHDGELERLVVLSPFYLDVAEASVPALRASGLAKSLTPGGPADDPHEAGSGIADCTFTSDPGPFEDRPVNCLTWTMARDFCASLGKTLPSEAQQEWVMSGLGAGRFVWGTDFPRCEDAVWGRTNAADACGVLGSGSTPSGVGWRDRLLLGDREVVDLNGNLIEWAADRWNRQDEPCWGVGLFLDPVCDATGSVDGVARSIRGGHWASPLTTLPAAVRARVINETQAVSAYVGVRCSRPAQPAP
jgi:formylglycine-generating enzyme required for sulfatase activity